MFDFEAGLGQFVLEVVDNEVNGNLIVLFVLCPGSWHDDVCILKRWSHELDEGRLDELVVRLENSFDGTSTFLNVPGHTSRQPNVIVCMHENSEVQEFVVYVLVQK